MKKLFTVLTSLMVVASANAESNESYNLIHIQQPANNKGSILNVTGTSLGGIKAASSLFEVVNHGSAYSVLKGYGCPFVAQYDKNMYNAEFKCSDPKAGRMVRFTAFDGSVIEAFVVTPTKECTVSLQLTYAPKNVALGTKNVAYSTSAVNASGDGRVITNGTEIEFFGASIDGSIRSPYTDTYMMATNNNTIKGDINTNGQLRVYADDETSVKNPSLNIKGGIHCNGKSVSDMGLVISGTEVHATSRTYQPVISGFTSFSIDEDKYMMVEPLGGRYDTEKRMLVDAHGKPATSFVVVRRNRFDDNDFIYNFNNEDASLDDVNNFEFNFNNEDANLADVNNREYNFNNEDASLADVNNREYNFNNEDTSLDDVNNLEYNFNNEDASLADVNNMEYNFNNEDASLDDVNNIEYNFNNEDANLADVNNIEYNFNNEDASLDDVNNIEYNFNNEDDNLANNDTYDNSYGNDDDNLIDNDSSVTASVSIDSTRDLSMR